tara:strand:- start:354 stop:623 length:270 start_codon:yes stop_codon:yes gene_type:complete
MFDTGENNMKKILMLSILLIVGTAQAEIVIVESSPVTRVNENTTKSLGITVVCVGGHIFVKDSTSLIQMYTTTKLYTVPFPVKCRSYKK